MEESGRARAERSPGRSVRRAAGVLAGGLIGGFVGEVGALVVLLPVAVLLAPLHLLLRAAVAGTIAGLVTFWIGERIVGDRSRGRLPLILLAAVLAAALYDGAMFFVTNAMDLPLPWVFSGLSLVRWPFVVLVGLVTGVAALTLRRPDSSRTTGS